MERRIFGPLLQSVVYENLMPPIREVKKHSKTAFLPPFLFSRVKSESTTSSRVWPFGSVVVQSTTEHLFFIETMPFSAARFAGIGH